MKFYNKHNTFDYTWHELVAAFWQRYPNPFASHVKSEDTLHRRVEGSKLYSTRLIAKTNKMPKWGEKIIAAPKEVFVIEESIVDREAKTLTTYTRNIGYAKILTVTEKCVYSVQPDKASSTQCERSAWIDSQVYGFSFAIQKFGLEKFKQSATKQVKGFNHVLASVYHPELLHTLSLPEKLKEKREKVMETAQLRKEQLKNTALKAKEFTKPSSVYAQNVSSE